MTRVCRICKIEKFTRDFHNVKNYKTGKMYKRGVCKVCRRIAFLKNVAKRPYHYNIELPAK